jgi:hypothetical protein
MHESNQECAGFVELAVWRAGRAIAVAGERLEMWVKALAVSGGYDDGEVSGIVAWPVLAR